MKNPLNIEELVYALAERLKKRRFRKTLQELNRKQILLKYTSSFCCAKKSKNQLKQIFLVDL